MIRWPAIPEGETSMLPGNYGSGDWTNGGIEAAKALWIEHNTHRSWQRLQQVKSAGSVAWMVYLT